MLAKIRPPGSAVDHLFVGTQRFQYFTCLWNAETRKLETVQHFTDVSEKHIRDSQSRDGCLVDPTGEYIMLELFEGVVNIIKVQKSKRGAHQSTQYLQKAEQVRIAELRMRASVFLHTETQQAKVAFLYEDGTGGDIKLATYRIVDEKLQVGRFDATKDRENQLSELDPGASHLIPVAKAESATKRFIGRDKTYAKAHLGGVIIVGETRLTYLDDESRATVEYLMEDASIFAAWERLDGVHYLLADIYSKLHLLTINVEDSGEVTGMEMRLLGKASKATAMVHLGGGIVFLGSHENDNQLIRVDINSVEEPLRLLSTMSNIAPILDFSVMDMGNREGESQINEYSTGQARLVTGSGVFQGGSLRSVRSGVGLETIGEFDAEMTDIQKVFSLRSHSDILKDDVLAVSLPMTTRLFRIASDGDVEELDQLRGLDLNLPTLLAMNLSAGFMLQVTCEAVRILGLGPVHMLAEWKPPDDQRITAASANFGHVLLAANGTTLVSLDIQNSLKEIAVQALPNNEQIACLDVPSDIPGIGVVGFWNSGSISVLNLTNMNILSSEDLRRKNNASIPRAIAMTQLLPESNFGPTLFIAMEDGVVLTFSIDKSSYALSGRKSIVLGTQQAQFHVLPRKDGLNNVFATCEHPSLIYGEEGRIVYSAVTADNALSVCPFDSEGYPGAIAVATSEGIRICQIDTQRQTHVNTEAMGQTVRRIDYSPKERLFALGCINRELTKGEEVITSYLKLVDDVNFKQVGTDLPINKDGRPELIECVTRAEFVAEHDNHAPVERFLVGTSFLDDEEENVNGRLLVFGIDPDRNPFLVSSLELRSACRNISIMGNDIIAALNKTVVIYKYTEHTTRHGSLEKLSTFRTATCPIDLAVHDNFIAVADLMQSLSVVEIIKGEAGLPDRLEAVARHFQACWSTAVVYIDDHSYLESDDQGNLMVLKRNVDGVMAEDRKRMDLTCSMNLGEMVNKMQRIHVEPTPSAMVIPKAFLATVSYFPGILNPITH